MNWLLFVEKSNLVYIVNTVKVIYAIADMIVGILIWPISNINLTIIK